tara:strand:- start:54 stop:266 length:213 start_codon:yes stop_codon:yes gene_type:complete
MAILISGILIALVVAFKDNSPNYSFIEQPGTAYLKLNTQTGYVCYGNTFGDAIKKIRNDKAFKTMKFCDE